MEQEQKLFEADYTKLNFRIGIDVCENGSVLYCFDVKEGYTITYHTLIGVIEALKCNFVNQQSEKNKGSSTVITDLKEVQNSFEQALHKFNHPNDCLVVDSELYDPLKNLISKYCKGGEYENYHKVNLWYRNFSDLMLSDLAKISKWDYLKMRNMGEVSYRKLRDYLVSMGFNMNQP